MKLIFNVSFSQLEIFLFSPSPLTMFGGKCVFSLFLHLLSLFFFPSSPSPLILILLLSTVSFSFSFHFNLCLLLPFLFPPYLHLDHIQTTLSATISFRILQYVSSAHWYQHHHHLQKKNHRPQKSEPAVDSKFVAAAFSSDDYEDDDDEMVVAAVCRSKLVILVLFGSFRLMYFLQRCIYPAISCTMLHYILLVAYFFENNLPEYNQKNIHLYYHYYYLYQITMWVWVNSVNSKQGNKNGNPNK